MPQPDPMPEPETPADALTERLANRRKPGDPDFDAFYDASDEDLAEMASDAIRNWGRRR